MKLNLKKLLVSAAKAIVRKFGDKAEAAADAVIDKGADKAKKAVAKAVRKAK